MDKPPITAYGAPASEFSESFVDGMRRRMAVSYHKYGLREDSVGKVMAIEAAIQRIEKYQDDGNTEWLVDAANFVMMEFMAPQHPDSHYRATDSGESPGRPVVTSQGVRVTTKHNLDIN